MEILRAHTGMGGSGEMARPGRPGLAVSTLGDPGGK